MVEYVNGRRPILVCSTASQSVQLILLHVTTLQRAVTVQQHAVIRNHVLLALVLLVLLVQSATGRNTSSVQNSALIRVLLEILHAVTVTVLLEDVEIKAPVLTV